MTKWANYLSRKVILISIHYPGLRQSILDISKIRILCNHPLTDQDIKNLEGDYPEFIKELKTGMQYFSSKGQTVFFKTSRTSGKNDLNGSIQECFTYRDVLDRLTSNQLFYRDLIRPEIEFQLVLQAWVEIQYEFRIFIYDNQVIAVSQQKWYEKIRYNVDHMLLINRIMQTKFILPFSCAVLDVGFIKVNDINKSDDLELYLIECNPYGVWTSSGSSMFTWSEILKNQHEQNVVLISFKEIKT